MEIKDRKNLNTGLLSALQHFLTILSYLICVAAAGLQVGNTRGHFCRVGRNLLHTPSVGLT